MMIVGDATPLLSVSYVITLDSDTVLPPDSARAPGDDGAPAQPGVLRPGTRPHGQGLRHPPAAGGCLAAQRPPLAFCGDSLGPSRAWTRTRPRYPTSIRTSSARGHSPARASTTSTLSRLATHGRFPENTLLSHDLIEGATRAPGLARTSRSTTIIPTRYLTYTRRKHRWIRGDWQLLRWLAPRMSGPAGETESALGDVALEALRQPAAQSRRDIALRSSWRVGLCCRAAAAVDGNRARGDRRALAVLDCSLDTQTAAGQVVAGLLRGCRARRGVSAQQLALSVVFLPTRRR